MKESKRLILLKLIQFAKSSENKYKAGNYKGAIDDKREVNVILKSSSCDRELREKYEKELANIYSSKFDLINDYKKIIDESKRRKIISTLEKKSIEEYNNGDYERSIKALRRSEKYHLKIKQ